MGYSLEKFERIVRVAERCSRQEGPNLTSFGGFGIWKQSTPEGKRAMIEWPGIGIVGERRRNCYVGSRKSGYSVGNVLVMFYRTAARVEIVEASPERPFLATGMLMELGRMADILLRIERVEGTVPTAQAPDPSGLISVPLNGHLLDPMIRLMESLDKPIAAAIFGRRRRGRGVLSPPDR